MAYANGDFLSELFSLPGLVIEMFSADLMHVADLGINQYLLACVIWELLFVEWGGSVTEPEPVLARFLSVLRLASKQCGFKQPPINVLTMGMLRSTPHSAPKMKVKAAESRHLLKCLVWILQNFFPSDTNHRTLRLQACMKMQEMYDSLKADPYDPVATSTAGRKFVLLWSELGNEARGLAAARGRPQVLYRFYPKHHLLSGNLALNW